MTRKLDTVAFLINSLSLCYFVVFVNGDGL